MMFYKLMCELSNVEINECNNLINNNFISNRFDTYESVIFYIIDKKIVGFVGIADNGLNQLCTDILYRKKGIASNIIEYSKNILQTSIYLYICKKNIETKYLLNFYKKHNFVVEFENEIEYKMIYTFKN